MGRTKKSLKLMGAFGIVGESFKIIRSQAKLMGTITLVLIIPYIFTMFACKQFESLLLAEINSKEPTKKPNEFIVPVTRLLVLEFAYRVLFYVALMPSVVAVVYTVGSVYTGKQKPSFTSVVRLVPTVCKHLMTTMMWYFIFRFLTSVGFYFGLLLLDVGFILFGKLRPIPSYADVVVSVVWDCVTMYVTIVWQVASMTCVMEEEYYGFEGMKKSRRLMEGKRTTAWVLTISYLVIYRLFLYLEGKGNAYALGLGAKITYKTACLVLASVFTLVWEVAQSVLYFACKSQHGEIVDEGCVLEGYLGGYEHVNNSTCRFRSLKTNDSDFS